MIKLIWPSAFRFSNVTIDELSQGSGKFTVLTQQARRLADGLYVVDLSPEKRKTSLTDYLSKNLRNDLASDCLEQRRNHVLASLKSKNTVMLGPYGTDCDHDLTNGFLNNWIGQLGKLKGPIGGLTSPFSYFGIFGTVFCIHTEDKNFSSASLCLKGEKLWFGVPGKFEGQVIDFLKKFAEEQYQTCPVAHRHKSFFVGPAKLRSNGIPVFEALHGPNTMMFTFPAAFHEGLNLTMTAAVAINLSTPQWAEQEETKVCGDHCECGFVKDCVKDIQLKDLFDYYR